MGKSIADIFREALQESIDETIGDALKDKIKEDEEKEMNEEVQKVEKAVREIERKENKKRDVKMNIYYVVYSFNSEDGKTGHGCMETTTEEKITRKLTTGLMEAIKEEVDKKYTCVNVVIDNIIKLEE